MLIQPMGIRSEGIYRGAKPVRDPAYLRFIRRLPCCVCESQRGVEAAHTGSHGMSAKACDRKTIPLCRKHHQTNPNSYHALGPVAFAELHGLDVALLVAGFNAEFASRLERLA